MPSALYNCDESGFPLTARTGKVLAPIGSQAANNHSSLLQCVVPPFHVFPGERFKENPLKNAVPNSYFGRSDNGWMTASLFYGWLGNHFVKRIPPSRPVVLIVDGHGSHIDMEVSKLALENQVFLYCLLPHCTHCIQPCDVGLFRPLKSNWDKAVEEWEVVHLGEMLNKYQFAGVFRKAWEATLKVSTLVNSFKASGLCPLNRAAIKDDLLAPAAVYRQVPEDSIGAEEGKESNDINESQEEGGDDKENDGIGKEGQEGMGEEDGESDILGGENLEMSVNEVGPGIEGYCKFSKRS